METKNIILANYSRSIMDVSGNLNTIISMMNDNAEENNATIRTVNVLLETMRSLTVIIQNAVDEYKM